MDGPEAVKEIAKQVGGTITEMGALPDGSGFATMSMPLPKDHWIYQGDRQYDWGVTNVPPMPFRMGGNWRIAVGVLEAPPGASVELIKSITANAALLTKRQMADRIRAAGKYAVRCATMNGKEMDFDPDALLQNLVTGFLGYNTDTGLSNDGDANPEPRAQWCCNGMPDGKHEDRCRYSDKRNDSVQSGQPPENPPNG